ncbi:MAG: Hsp20/alpha crystallin family protein [Cryobacterium sp.]
MARNITRFNPFAELDALQKQFFEDGILSRLRTADFPITDVYTDENQQLTVETHLPNFDEKDISVDVDRGALVIQAQKHEKEEDSKKNYIVRESSSSFYRRIALPEQADMNKTTAEFVDGVLRIMVPFQAVTTPTKIAIGGASGEQSSVAAKAESEPAAAAAAESDVEK